MTSEEFELPRGVTGFGASNSWEAEERYISFLAWARALAKAHGSKIRELPKAEPWPCFSCVRLERLDMWLLHNRHVPLVGFLSVAPEPGPSWAVAGTFVDVAVPDHASSWGPQVVAGSTLNAALGAPALNSLAMAERDLADRYNPLTVGHVIFNYWA